MKYLRPRIQFCAFVALALRRGQLIAMKTGTTAIECAVKEIVGPPPIIELLEERDGKTLSIGFGAYHICKLLYRR